MQTLTLRLPMPPSVNRAYANRKGPGRGRVATKALREWKSAARTAIAVALVGIAQRPVFAGRVDVLLRVPVPTNGRGRDADNCAKAVLDALVACGVIADDNWRYVRRSSVEWVDDGVEGECSVEISLVSEMPAGKATRPRTAAKRGALVWVEPGEVSPVLERSAQSRKRPSPKAPLESSDAAFIAAVASRYRVDPSRVHPQDKGASRMALDRPVAASGRPKASRIGADS